MFSCDFYKVFKNIFLQNTSGQLSMCFVLYFSKFEMEKAFWMILQYYRNCSCKLSLQIVGLLELPSEYCLLKMIKFPQWCLQSEALQRNFERSVPLVNDHPAIFKIIPKFYKNGSCIHTISFLLTIVRPMTCLFTITSIYSIQQSTRNRNLETIWKVKPKQGNKLIVLLR